MDVVARRALRDRCRWLHGGGPRSPSETLRKLADYCEKRGLRFDAYGQGEAMQELETSLATRLGFEAARFMPSGTMAQQIALRIWCEGHPHFGMHPTSHLELHEEHGYKHLHKLRSTLVGPDDAPLLAEHLNAVSEPLAALLVELPAREAGGLLPSLEQLAELKQAAHERGVRLHLDGARLWECAPFYGCEYEEICAGFDSVYVSFYKGIGALPGAMLLGPRAFIDQAAVWQRRQGGNLYTLTPNAASAAMLLDERIARMTTYYERAHAVARVLRSIPGIEVVPDPPQTCMVHVQLPVSAETANEARDAFAQQTGVWLFGGAMERDRGSRVELYLGEGALTVTDEEIAAGFSALSELGSA